MENRVNGRHQPRARGQAWVKDVLGGATSRRRVPQKWGEHYRSLTRLREYFAGDMRTRSQHAKMPLSTSDEHMADGASDSYDRDWALAMASSDRAALYEIDQALNRLANGSYGICELTGKPIDSARLRSIPWTRFCAKAQAELEARGITTRPQLGALGTCASVGEADITQRDEDEEIAPAERQAA